MVISSFIKVLFGSHLIYKTVLKGSLISNRVTNVCGFCCVLLCFYQMRSLPVSAVLVTCLWIGLTKLRASPISLPKVRPVVPSTKLLHRHKAQPLHTGNNHVDYLFPNNYCIFMNVFSVCNLKGNAYRPNMPPHALLQCCQSYCTDSSIAVINRVFPA